LRQQVPIPDNSSAAQTGTTPCVKCKTWWVFHFDADGRDLDLNQKGVE
jgi:hypothetical protein